MILSHTIPIIITKQQVLDFANLTGDNIYIHVEDGIVQGGLILSMLPQWSKKAIELFYIENIPNNLITIKMDCKFHNKLYCNNKVNITFYHKNKFKLHNINWSIHNTIKYCSGTWILSEI